MQHPMKSNKKQAACKCSDCVDCLCESLCSEYEEDSFTNKVTKKEGEKDE